MLESFFKKHKKALVVDDEAYIRKLVSVGMIKLGFKVVEACCGEEAIKKARSESPDIIVMDVSMPDMTGCQTCRLLKEDDKTYCIPVILLTGSGKPADVDEGYKNGASAYVLKPIVWDQLKEKIIAVLSGDMDQHSQLLS